MKFFSVTILSLFLLSTGINSLAQIEIDWLHNIKAKGYSQVIDFMHVDGSIYLSHCSKGEVEDQNYRFRVGEGKTITSLIKLDDQGHMIWKNSVIAEETRIAAIASAPNGNIVVAGHAKGETIFISNGETQVLQSDAHSFLFLVQYKTDGTFIRMDVIEQKMGRRILYPTSLAVNSHGDLYVGLNYYGPLSDNGEIIKQTDTDKEYSAVFKFDSNDGFKEIVNQWELIGTRAHVDVKIDKEDQVIIAGYSRGEVSLSEKVKIKCSEGNIYTPNTSFSFVAKYTPDNTLLWHQKIGGRNDQIISDLVLSSKNEIYIYGTYTFECIFSNGIPTNNTAFERRFEGSIFYAKLQPEGDLSFVKYIRSKGGNACVSGSMAIDEKDQIHLTGSYNGRLNFNSFSSIEMGEILENNPSPKSHWQVNTRGNSAWFYSVWKDDQNLYSQNIYDLNGFPDAQYIRKLAVCGETVMMGGFYHVGEPSLIALPENIELGASGDSGMYSIFVGGRLPDIQVPEFVESNLFDAAVSEATTSIEVENNETEIHMDSLISDTGPLAKIVSKSQRMKAFPNPAVDYINIELKDFYKPIDLMIFSSDGKVLYTQSLDYMSGQENLRINLSDWSRGTYYILVMSEGFRKSIPFVKID